MVWDEDQYSYAYAVVGTAGTRPATIASVSRKLSGALPFFHLIRITSFGL